MTTKKKKKLSLGKLQIALSPIDCIPNVVVYLAALHIELHLNQRVR